MEQAFSVGLFLTSCWLWKLCLPLYGLCKLTKRPAEIRKPPLLTLLSTLILCYPWWLLSPLVLKSISKVFVSLTKGQSCSWMRHRKVWHLVLFVKRGMNVISAGLWWSSNEMTDVKALWEYQAQLFLALGIQFWRRLKEVSLLGAKCFWWPLLLFWDKP